MRIAIRQAPRAQIAAATIGEAIARDGRAAGVCVSGVGTFLAPARRISTTGHGIPHG
jgi:hypothetical protein